jgi:hypothetical protein
MQASQQEFFNKEWAIAEDVVDRNAIERIATPLNYIEPPRAIGAGRVSNYSRVKEDMPESYITKEQAVFSKEQPPPPIDAPTEKHIMPPQTMDAAGFVSNMNRSVGGGTEQALNQDPAIYEHITNANRSAHDVGQTYLIKEPAAFSKNTVPSKNATTEHFF